MIKPQHKIACTRMVVCQGEVTIVGFNNPIHGRGDGFWLCALPPGPLPVRACVRALCHFVGISNPVVFLL